MTSTTHHWRWVAAALCAAAAGPLVARGDDPSAGPGPHWPQYAGPQRSGVSAETNWKADWGADGPKVAWKADVGKGFSSFAVVGKRAYTMGSGGGGSAVFCLNAETGELLWRRGLGGGEPAGTPAADETAVYAVARDGTVGCLDAAKGTVRWQCNAGRDFGAAAGQWQIACSPLLDDKGIVLDVGKLLLLDKAAGRPIWTAGNDTAGYSSSVAFKVGSADYLTSFNGFGLVVVNAATGREAARCRWQTSYGVNAALPMVSGGDIFICSGYGRGAGLLRLTGAGLKLLYDKKIMRSQCNGPALIGGCLYGLDGQGGSNGSLQCVEMATGEVKWSEPMKCGAISAAGDRLIVQADGGELVVARASPAGFRALGRARVLSGQCWTMPVLCGGRIYCRNTAGQVVCLDVWDGTAQRGGTPAAKVPPKPPAPKPPAPTPRPAPGVSTDESRADAMLRLAETYLRAGMKSAGEARLKEVVQKYPSTKAAAAARERLKAMQK